MASPRAILGLDIGGANLKAAHTAGVARTVAFPLWKQPERLAAELARLCSSMPPFDHLAVTMTGELCDCFESIPDGVQQILRRTRDAFGKTPIRVWTTEGRFLEPDEAVQTPRMVGAANWLALAQLVASRFASENVLLIDTGSTTTDIVYLKHGVPEPRGRTDAERLVWGELVYTGVRRTPICAVLGMDVAAEFFATMLDAYLNQGLAPESLEDCDTADGRPATFSFAHARLARLRCCDGPAFSERDAHDLARRAVQAQWQTVQRAMALVADGRPRIDRLVVAGSGEILGRSVCTRFEFWSSLPSTSLSDLIGRELSTAACAYAVAMLAAQEKTDGQ